MIKKILILLSIIVIITLIFFLMNYIEWYAPEVKIDLKSKYAGNKPIKIEITDKGRGLRYYDVKLQQNNGEILLGRNDYLEPIYRDDIQIDINSKKYPLNDGPAKLIVEAGDRSLLNFLHGNVTVETRDIVIDTKPPTLGIVSTEHYINHGGSGLVIYQTSDDSVSSGVRIGKNEFPGYKAHFRNNDVYLCFFAFPYYEDPNDNIIVYSTDAAGNSTQQSFFYKLKPIEYKKSTITVSDQFIDTKMRPLLQDSNVKDPIEVFLKVNSELRKQNNEKIAEITRKTSPTIYWKGSFHQLTNSKVEANFADERTYIYNNEPIDKEYHLGYDLAVTKRYPIEAANDGMVLYADALGIYGNAVIIDHGMGIATLYGHMSSIDVKPGDMVRKRQIIGHTGQTGLAAGDHLHYGVYVNGIAVRPIEWWDDKWIKDNIILKILRAQQEFGGADEKSDS